MQRETHRLADEELDVLVVGGGVYGLSIAWDAVSRGLRTGLIDKGDFGAATSANSLKTIHGGLRYLQHLDFRRMRESIAERTFWMRVAPHLIEPLPFLVPTGGFGLESKAALATAAWINDWVGRRRNDGLETVGLEIPNSRVLGLADCCEMVPWLAGTACTGGVQFHDAQMYSSERTTMAFAHAAANQGAALANYVEATEFILADGTCRGVVARDVETGDTFPIRAQMVVNAAGPWNDGLVRLMQPGSRPKPVRLSKGIQLVTRDLSPHTAVALKSRYQDPDAVLSRGARHYFVTPWRGVSLFGTTDSLFEGDPDDFEITAPEVDQFVAELQDAMPQAEFGRAQVLHAFGGLRPVEEKNVASGSQTRRHSLIRNHRDDLGIDRLLTVVGVKYTTCRQVAERVVDRVVDQLGIPVAPCSTRVTTLWGGDTGEWSGFLRGTVDRIQPQVGTPAATHLVRCFGSEVNAVLEGAVDVPERTRPLPGRDDIIEAQVHFAVEQEAAVRLDDVVSRRTDLAAFGYPGAPAIERCAVLMQSARGWDDTRRAREMDAVNALFPIRPG